MDGEKGEEGIHQVMIRLEVDQKKLPGKMRVKTALLCKSYNLITLHRIDNLSLKLT